MKVVISLVSPLPRVKSSVSLVSCVNPGVAVVKYAYESTTLAKLLQLVAATLKGRLALSIALLVHGQPGYFKMCAQKASVCHTFRPLGLASNPGLPHPDFISQPFSPRRRG